jgi:hypothetical protein
MVVESCAIVAQPGALRRPRDVGYVVDPMFSPDFAYGSPFGTRLPVAVVVVVRVVEAIVP